MRKTLLGLDSEEYLLPEKRRKRWWALTVIAYSVAFWLVILAQELELDYLKRWEWWYRVSFSNEVARLCSWEPAAEILAITWKCLRDDAGVTKGVRPCQLHVIRLLVGHRCEEAFRLHHSHSQQRGKKHTEPSFETQCAKEGHLQCQNVAQHDKLWSWQVQHNVQ